jgi:hypothetical protein
MVVTQKKYYYNFFLDLFLIKFNILNKLQDFNLTFFFTFIINKVYLRVCGIFFFWLFFYNKVVLVERFFKKNTTLVSFYTKNSFFFDSFFKINNFFTVSVYNTTLKSKSLTYKKITKFFYIRDFILISQFFKLKSYSLLFNEFSFYCLFLKKSFFKKEKLLYFFFTFFFNNKA